MWCASDNHNDMCYMCSKELLDSNFNYAVIDKISNEIVPNLSLFLKYNRDFLHQPILPYEFYGINL